MINHSYIEGAYRFVDGSMQVSLELINVIRANGGTVLNNSEVTRIIVENEKVQGVIINGEERLESDFVISNMHPQRTLEILDKTVASRMPIFPASVRWKTPTASLRST